MEIYKYNYYFSMYFHHKLSELIQSICVNKEDTYNLQITTNDTNENVEFDLLYIVKQSDSKEKTREIKKTIKNYLNEIGINKIVFKNKLNKNGTILLIGHFKLSEDVEQAILMLNKLQDKWVV